MEPTGWTPPGTPTPLPGWTEFIWGAVALVAAISFWKQITWLFVGI